MEANETTEPQEGRIGSSFNEFLDEEGIREEVQEQALKEMLAWQIQQEMQAAHLSKTAMARRVATSRAQLDRLLDPANTSVTLHTLQKATIVVGRRLRLELDSAGTEQFTALYRSLAASGTAILVR